MTTKQLVKRYKALVERQKKLDDDFGNLRAEALLQGCCDHSVFHDWTQTRGDGYGRTYPSMHRSCLICGQKFHKYGINGEDWKPYKEEDLCDPWKD